MMRIEQLNYLIDLASTGSMNESANKFFITQPAFSKAITNLEKELGHQLLKRSKKGSLLTPAGEIVVAQGRVLLDDFQVMHEQLEELTKTYHREIVGDINLATTTICNTKILVDRLPSFQQQFPNVEVNINISNRLGVENMVETDYVTLALVQQCFSDVVKQTTFHNQPYEKETLSREKFFTLVYKENPLFDQALVNLEDIKPYPLLLINNSGQKISDLDQFFIHHGKLDGIKNTGSINHFKQQLLTKEHLTIITRSFFGWLNKYHEFDDKDWRLIPLHATLEQHIIMYHKTESLLTDAQQYFIAALRD